jgi:hypothetical protein
MTGRRVRREQGYWDELAGDGVAVETLRDDVPDHAGTGVGADAVTVDAPSRTDPVVRAASPVIGGPAGRRLASGAGFWRAVPVLILLATAVLGLGAVQKQHCRAEGWTTPDQFWHACYSDVAVLYGSSGLGGPDRPGLSEALGPGGLGTPPVTGAAMWLVSAFVPDDDADATRRFFDLSAVLLLVVLAVAVAAVGVTAARRGRPWDAAHVALSPVLVTAGLVSYALLAVMLLALAIAAWSRERQVAAGVLLGLAVAAAPVLWLLAPLALLLGYRSGRPGPAVTFAGWALVSWFLVRVALLPGLTGGLRTGWDEWTGTAPGYGSVWMIPQLRRDSEPAGVQSVGGRILMGLFGWLFAGGALGTGAATVATVLLAGAGLLVVAWFGVLSVPGRPVRAVFAPLALAVLSVGLLTMRALPVQATLVLLPLMALSALPWRDHLIWATTELVYFVGVWLYIAADTTPDRGLPAFFYLVLMVARLAGIGYLGVAGVHAARAISRGPARADRV